jgi:hypothetical protein
MFQVTIQDLRRLRAIASQNGRLEAWSDIALQFAEEAVLEIRSLKERIKTDESAKTSISKDSENR